MSLELLETAIGVVVEVEVEVEVEVVVEVERNLSRLRPVALCELLVKVIECGDESSEMWNERNEWRGEGS